MGQLYYKGAGQPLEIEDRTLAHLRVIFMTKLRRGEPFLFETSSPHGTGHREFWIHPSLPLQFHFAGSRSPQLNPRWIDALMASANGPAGLQIVPEPQA
ncbi:DUF7882 family protein [Microbacterium oleivorans]|uniref:ATP-dependent DNA ligase n=1 Tax=Microbacterium oleivorans TaxID=273677 RepID=A0A7D5EVQ0_9MICO|nr:ATP-dependent DNA ligase [Microbacterium oleivorans]QLD10864.1 ATP-dependent DNA ligase [Microbacterium oleivorans]